MKLCQLASGQSFSVRPHAETGFNICLVYFYFYFYRDRRWRAAVNAVARGRRASAVARRSARSDHMGTSTEVVSKIESPV